MRYMSTRKKEINRALRGIGTGLERITSAEELYEAGCRAYDSFFRRLYNTNRMPRPTLIGEIALKRYEMGPPQRKLP